MEDQNKEKSPETINLKKEAGFERIDKSEGEMREVPLSEVVEGAFEKRGEGFIEKKSERQDEAIDEYIPPSSIINQGELRKIREEKLKNIELILEDGLANLYIQMEPGDQKRFKVAGEEAVVLINDMLDRGRYTARKIMDVIKKWLSLIPGVNNFFLEQEAKIKTDKIMKLQNNYDK